MKEKGQELPNTGSNFDLPVAKEVLRLCRFSFDEFIKVQPTGDKWKLHYFLILTLLRTVREGLNVDKEDPELHPNMAIEIGNFFQNIKASKPTPEIYWYFITQETNTLLHEFASTQGSGQSSDPQGNRQSLLCMGPSKAEINNVLLKKLYIGGMNS